MVSGDEFKGVLERNVIFNFIQALPESWAHSAGKFGADVAVVPCYANEF